MSGIGKDNTLLNAEYTLNTGLKAANFRRPNKERFAVPHFVINHIDFGVPEGDLNSEDIKLSEKNSFVTQKMQTISNTTSFIRIYNPWNDYNPYHLRYWSKSGTGTAKPTEADIKKLGLVYSFLA